jgi:hypothetical protein
VFVSTGTKEGNYAFPLWVKPKGAEHREVSNFDEGGDRILGHFWRIGANSGSVFQTRRRAISRPRSAAFTCGSRSPRAKRRLAP